VTVVTLVRGDAGDHRNSREVLFSPLQFLDTAPIASRTPSENDRTETVTLQVSDQFVRVRHLWKMIEELIELMLNGFPEPLGAVGCLVMRALESNVVFKVSIKVSEHTVTINVNSSLGVMAPKVVHVFLLTIPLYHGISGMSIFVLIVFITDQIEIATFTEGIAVIVPVVNTTSLKTIKLNVSKNESVEVCLSDSDRLFGFRDDVLVEDIRTQVFSCHVSGLP
jgi:hypothetical protein